MQKDFFVESAFDEIYKKTFLDEDIRDFAMRAKQSRENKKPEEILTAQDPVRMFNEVDINRESTQAINANYRLNGDFNNNFSNYFSGKIFGNI